MSNRKRSPPDRLLAQPPCPAPPGRDDRLAIIGRRNTAWGDLYHQALQLSWPRFLLLGTLMFLSLNLFFGLLYSLQPEGITDFAPASFPKAFFFSVQTLATIGYGKWAPVSTYINSIVTLETFIGLSTIAVFTALAFTRFARPTAKLAFSRNLVVTRYNGCPTLMLRLANERGNQILEARVSLSVLLDATTAEGQYIRRLHDLALVRDHTPVLGNSFQVMHHIDETSPLHGFTPERLRTEWVDIVALVAGIDETMMQTVHARAEYDGSEIVFNHRFTDMFGYLPDGRRAIDFRQFHRIEPDGLS